MVPRARTVASTAALSESRLVRSHCSAMAVPPALWMSRASSLDSSVPRAANATRAPSRAAISAVAEPICGPTPARNRTFPASSPSRCKVDLPLNARQFVSNRRQSQTDDATNVGSHLPTSEPHTSQLCVLEWNDVIGVVNIAQNKPTIHDGRCHPLPQHQLVVPGRVRVVVHQWTERQADTLQTSLVLVQIPHAEHDREHAFAMRLETVIEGLIEVRALRQRGDNLQPRFPAQIHDEPHFFALEAHEFCFGEPFKSDCVLLDVLGARNPRHVVYVIDEFFHV